MIIIVLLLYNIYYIGSIDIYSIFTLCKILQIVKFEFMPERLAMVEFYKKHESLSTFLRNFSVSKFFIKLYEV